MRDYTSDYSKNSSIVYIYDANNWIGVDVFRKYLLEHNTEETDNAATKWLQENIKGRWKKIQRLDFIFEQNSDALYFKMIWG